MSCLTSLLSIKNQVLSPLYYCPYTEATYERRKDFSHFWIWVSGLHMISTSASKIKLSLEWQNNKKAVGIYTYWKDADPEIPTTQPQKTKQQHYQPLPSQAIREGEKGRFFHRMNLSFHHVPKYPCEGLDTKWTEKKLQKHYIHLKVHIPTLPAEEVVELKKQTNKKTRLQLLPKEAIRKREEEIFIHPDLHDSLSTSPSNKELGTKWNNTIYIYKTLHIYIH